MENKLREQKIQKVEELDVEQFLNDISALYFKIPDFHGNIKRMKQKGINPYENLPIKAIKWSKVKRMLQQTRKKLYEVKNVS